MNITALFRICTVLCVIGAFDISASAQQKKTANPTDQAVLLGQFGEWGAYRAMPGGKKICFALAKPTSTTSAPTGRNGAPSYPLVATRPTEKVTNEVSVLVGYQQQPGQDASA